MSLASTQPGFSPPPSTSGSAEGVYLRVPDSLERQLLAYRRRVWTIKIVEAIAIALFALLVAFLTVFIVDRVADMPRLARGGILIAVLAVASVIPLFLHRWVWRRRGLEQLARLLSHKMPSVGDSLLGVIELAQNHAEQSRSPALCHAAIRQVAADAEKRNLFEATPRSRYRRWSIAALSLVLVSLVLGFSFPAAASNSLARLVMPWNNIPRYTFTRVDRLPATWYVPHGEPVPLAIGLTDQTRMAPEQGVVRVGSQQPLRSGLVDGQYAFVIPPQIEPQWVTLDVGDSWQRVRLEPTLRPELTSVVGRVTLPEYLGRDEQLEKDVRGGTVSLVKGSTAVFSATANRPLSAATINGASRRPTETVFASPEVAVDTTPNLHFEWQDQHGLAGREPFDLSITVLDDEAPTLVCEGLPRQAVVLDSEMIKFTVRASDDFGIARVGILWRGLPTGLLSEPAQGERVLAAGGNDKSVLDVIGTFSASSYGIEAQPIELFVWSEDYLPGRPRVLSPPYTLYVLTPDQHAIWMTEQLSKWHRQALEVRDREMQLYETNKELRSLPEDQLDLAENREAVERQANAERSNGRRLAKLSELGDELIRTASRNPEIGVGHLERWAEMLTVLRDISSNRMPSVADLLKETADSPRLAAGSASKSGPAAGQNRAAAAGAGSKPAEGPQTQPPAAPQIVDMESSQNSPDENPLKPGAPKKPSGNSLRLPTTTVMGKSQKSGEQPPPPPANEKLDQAVEEQEDLLAEFERIAEELNTILANLEGSTLVKRLKAASRTQYLVAGRITEQLDDAFGKREARIDDQAAEVFGEMAIKEEESVQDVSYIMDDMAAYFERRRFAQFKLVLDDMKQSDVIGGLRQLSDEIPAKHGLSVAECEYWSDSLDRWAEDLVDPACKGECPGGKTPASLPPSIVLEVLQILEAEVNLRDETRVAEQARPAAPDEKYGAETVRLSEAQSTLQSRIAAVVDRIKELPDSSKHFGKELALLSKVDVVMGDAADILGRPETGAPAIAAETEAIELLLQSKRINPKGGGGGGSSPGGGGGGTTVDSALTLLGTGANQKEVREDRDITQTTGSTGTVLPEEFRAGLDEYFNRIERVSP